MTDRAGTVVDVATQTQRFFREDNPAFEGRTWFFRFSPGPGTEVWTGERWKYADNFTERLFTDPDFEEIPEAGLPATAIHASCEVCQGPITADSAGWRKWCEENPEKCGGGGSRLSKDPLKNARALKELSYKIDVLNSRRGTERTDAIVALGAEVQRLTGLPQRAEAMGIYQTEVVAAMDGDLAAAQRIIELRNTPGQTIDDMPLHRDFQSQVLDKDEEWQRLDSEADGHAQAASAAKDLAKNYPDELRSSLQQVGVRMGPTAEATGPAFTPADRLDEGVARGSRNQYDLALADVPTDWIERIGSTQIWVRENDLRAYYSHDEIHVGPSSNADTYRHEMMHALESRSVEIHDAQRALLVSRMGTSAMTVIQQDKEMGMRRAPLNELVDRMPNPPMFGGGYNSDEYAIDAGFPHPYTSKHYTSGHSEILSTGMQALFSKDPKTYEALIDGDKQFEQWILGMIVKTGL